MIDQHLVEQLSVLTDEERAILAGETKINRDLYMDGSRDVITGDKVLESGKNITIRPHTRFIAFPEHSHDYVEMVYMCRGSTTHIINDTRLVLQEGELLILGQNARQKIEAAGKNDLAVNFIVRPVFFSSILPYLGESETPLHQFILGCLYGENESGYLHFRVAEIHPIQNLIENMLYTLQEEIPNRRGILQMTMGLLFLQLLNHTDTIAMANSEQTTLLHALRYIEAHYRDGSLSELSEEIPYELTALSRLIRQKTGKTYTELVQERRMSQASWLLKNTDRKVDEIARSVGYENLTYFHRLFAETFGTTAKKYRDKA